MKLYVVAYARMPTEKAHGIQIAKMCEAFAALGVTLELVVPSRGSGSIDKFYGLTHTIPLRRIPVLDLQFLGPLGYRLTVLQFDVMALIYLWAKVRWGERFALYTLDMDSFSFVPFKLIPRPLFVEMHSNKKHSFYLQWFFTRANIIATNKLIADSLARTFHISPAHLCIEPNGVDQSAGGHAVTKEEARRRLGLSNEPFALYLGRLYAWKGLGILSETAALSPLPIKVVGGTQEEYELITGKKGAGLDFVGAQPLSDVPLWLAAADVLLLLGTAKNEESYRYTAPMKIFEYLASVRPMVASRTPANTSIIGEDMAYWYEPDRPSSLANAIREAHASPRASTKVEAGRAFAAEHTWQKRAERILAFITYGN